MRRDYRGYYNGKAQAIVAEAYRSDIELFGYDFEGEEGAKIN
jgi:hypothetical protein